jgi:hypothetical protein
VSPSDLWAWLGLFGLGAFHGVNPGMGWLFAVALALQEKSRSAIYRSLPPMALGHALSMAVVVGLMAGLGVLLSPVVVRRGAAGALMAFGVYRLVRTWHPRWVGMRVGARDLVVWSFLMASAHGAGLMLVPLLLGNTPQGHSSHGPLPHSLPTSQVPSPEPLATLMSPGLGLMAVGVHTGGYFLTMALVAVLVYEKLGLALLRHAWFNLDWLWAVALVVVGVCTLLL